MAVQKPASQVTPFAAMTLGDQNTRWLTLHSQLMPYMTAVPAKTPPHTNDKPDSNPAWRTGTPAFGQMPIYNSSPQSTRHDQYDAVHKKMDQARKNTLAWQEISSDG